MTITQGKALRAYAVLNELMRMPFQLRDAMKLLKLKREMEYVYEFQVQEERKLVDEFHPDVQDGRYVFNTESADAETTLRIKSFQEKMNAIGNMEIELEVSPIELTITGNDEIRLTPEKLIALEGFVTFTE